MKPRNTNIVDGQIAIILQALRNHSVIEAATLKNLISNEFENDDLYEQVLEFTETNQWIRQKGDSIRITEEGQAWLDSKGGTLAVEKEDSNSSDTPKHPYDVAKLMMETKHLSVFQALRKIEKKEINLNPDFQRAFVWDQIKKSRLIESILIRIPLPAFYLDATDQVHWVVVDGLQRLTTLNEYCRKQTFSLSNMQFLAELNGKRFDELPSKFKILIEDDTQLLFYNLMPGTPAEAKFTIFSRVNTGGMQLTPQEIRHALSQGKVTAALANLACSNEFKRVTQGVVESLRMSDRELVLRTLSFMSLGVDEYKQFSELDAFLLNAMNNINSMSDSKVDELKRRFIASLIKVETVFGIYAFRKFYERGGRRSPLNKSLFEVWTVCVDPYEIAVLKTNKEKIVKGFIDLLNHNERFLKSISASTGSFSAVSSRFAAVEKLLKEVCHD